MQRYLLAILLSLSSLSYADTIRCYDSGREIYHHKVKDTQYTGEAFVFEEVGTRKIMFFTGDCIVKIDN